jgi:hypothetical protein
VLGRYQRGRTEEAPAFKLSNPAPFIQWIVGRMEQISTETNEAIKTEAAAMHEVAALLREIRDSLKEEEGGRPAGV